MEKIDEPASQTGFSPLQRALEGLVRSCFVCHYEIIQKHKWM